MWTATWLVIGFAFLGFSLLLKYTQGSFSPRRVWLKHRELDALEQEYDEMADSRTSMLHHMDWAKSRGDDSEADAIVKSIADLDAKMDELSSRIAAASKEKIH